MRDNRLHVHTTGIIHVAWCHLLHMYDDNSITIATVFATMSQNWKPIYTCNIHV